VNAAQRGASLQETRSSWSAFIGFEDVQRLNRLATDGAYLRFDDPHPELHDGAEGGM
jgi:hypothetical protein